MARTKGARKKGRTKRIGTKRMRKTYMKKGDKGTKGKKGKKKTRKRKMKGGASQLKKAGISPQDTSRAGDLAELRKKWIKEGLTPIPPPAESYDVLKKKYDKQMKEKRIRMKEKRKRMKAAERAAEEAAEEALASTSAAKIEATRRIRAKNFLDFKKKLLDEILYKYDEDYVSGDLSMLEDGPFEKVKALFEKSGFNSSQLDMLRDEFGSNPSDLFLISDMEQLYNVEKDRLAAKAEQDRLSANKAGAAEKAELIAKFDREKAARKIKNFLDNLHLNINKYYEGELESRVDHYKKNNERIDEAKAAKELVELIENLRVAELDQLDLHQGIINELKNLKVAEERAAAKHMGQVSGNYKEKVLPTDN